MYQYERYFAIKMFRNNFPYRDRNLMKITIKKIRNDSDIYYISEHLMFDIGDSIASILRLFLVLFCQVGNFHHFASSPVTSLTPKIYFRVKTCMSSRENYCVS